MTRKLIKTKPVQSPRSCRLRVKLKNRRVVALPTSDGDILFKFIRLPMYECEEGKRIVETRLLISQEAVGAMFSLMNCLTREGII